MTIYYNHAKINPVKKFSKRNKVLQKIKSYKTNYVKNILQKKSYGEKSPQIHQTWDDSNHQIKMRTNFL